MKNRWIRLIQAVLTFGLTTWLFRQVAWSSLRPTLADLRWGFIALSAAVLLLGHLINVIRWQYLLPQRRVAYTRLLVFYGAGLFSNSFLPTGYGGDGIRVVLLGQSIPLRDSFFSVGLDRAIGLVALSALLGFGLWGGRPPGMALKMGELATTADKWRSILPAILIFAVISALGFLILGRLSGLRRRVSNAIDRIVGNVDWTHWTAGRWFRILTGGYAISVLAHVCIVTATWLLLLAVRINVAPAASVWLVLASTISLLFPITVNGLGVREALFVTILGAYNVPYTPAFLAAVLGRVIQVFFVALGGTAWLFNSRSAKT